MSTKITLQIRTFDEEEPERSFTDKFSIGRGENCDVQIAHHLVSRNHAEVFTQEGDWWLKDLGSTNGTYLNGERIGCVKIDRPSTIQLSKDQIFVCLNPHFEKQTHSTRPGGAATLDQYVDHYFSESDSDAGEHTMMIRKAFKAVNTRQKKRFTYAIVGAVVLLLGISSYAFYLHKETAKQKTAAESVFYSMKSLEIELASIDQAIMESKSPSAIEVIKKYRNRRTEMAANYDAFLGKLRVYDRKMSEQERLILRVARIFGECELVMPKGFVPEIENYIAKWRSTDRLKQAIATAHTRGYTRRISDVLLAHDLPPQYFYLALQESSFDVYSVGPATYMGYAKGMWQFIPETAMKFGLKVGPLTDLARPDPRDERHDFEKSTDAAARYIKFIYSTDAQASGLLVMASYNWGENKVVDLLRQIPANPKDRNFWQLLSKYRDKIPQETYDYVFYITSAAVIGENPRLFGFQFDNPLFELKKSSS